MSSVGGLVARERPNLAPRALARSARVSEHDVSRRAAVAARLREATTRPHVRLTASGRGALLALLATAERPRALVPGYTCKAVAEAALLAGVDVVYADVTDGFNWSPADVAAAATPDSVVLLTHQFGIAGRAAEIVAAAHAAGALVIEDCAGGLGGRSDGRPLGSFGDAAFFSFDMSKLVHVPPKGGALATEDEGWASRARAWLARETAPMSTAAKARALTKAGVLAATGARGYRAVHTAMLAGRGRATTDVPEVVVARNGFYDTEFAEWQAAVALPQLERLDALAADARGRYARYREALAGCRAIELPPADTRGEWAPIRFPVLVRGDKLAYYEQLLARGVDCAFSFTYLARRDGLPRSTELADRVLDLPFHPGLRQEEADQVVAAVLDLDRTWAA